MAHSEEKSLGPRLSRGGTFVLSGLLLVASVGCGSATSEPDGFVSEVPGRSDRGQEKGLSQAGSADTDDGNILYGDGDEGGDGDGDGDSGSKAERAIAEADIIQQQGDLLYALSRYSGLSIVDLSDPTDLRLLGVYRSAAEPFEMYLEGDTAYIMFNGWESYVDDDFGRWETSSRMVALNVSKPSSISLVGEYDVAGEISDSRKVGDILYLVTHQNSWCYRCDEIENTQVSSFDVSDPSKFARIDRLRFESEAEGYGPRHVAVSQERLYIGGTNWSNDEQEAGSIDVVDISDPDGDLQQGASLEIAGMIQNRWQMNEHEGTLRVISQPGGWGTITPPMLEVFEIETSSKIKPLASLELVLPRPEELRSVRFDGDRAYAITFEQTDPLFTFDLSDPSQPVQAGELEIPGWVYHMEPRGDRIFALGFDEGSDAGALHVSLFDVSDLSQPTMLDRANFGGDWGSFAEDVDRVHKSFKILPDEGLILVPFSGSGYDEESCRYEHNSGIQLVDMTGESLTLRGVAPQVGEARRAFLHESTLFGVSDNAVQAFELSDRDEPALLDRLDVARHVSTLSVVGDAVLRFGGDWLTSETVLDFVDVDNAESPEPLGRLDLAALVEAEQSYCNGESEEEEGDERWEEEYGYWSEKVFVRGDYAYVPYLREHYVESEDEYYKDTKLVLFTVDISDKSQPEVVDRLTYELGETTSFQGMVQTEDTLLVAQVEEPDYSDARFTTQEAPRFFYTVLDLSEPAEPKKKANVTVPSLTLNNGWGSVVSDCSIDMGWGWGGGGGDSGALVSGNIVLSQHQEEVEGEPAKLRYFMDRLDVSDPSDPQSLPAVNVPGTVIHFDEDSGQMVSLDYVRSRARSADANECYNRAIYAEFNPLTRSCLVYHRRLHVLRLEGSTAVLLDSYDIDEGLAADSIAVTEGKIFFTRYTYDEEEDEEHFEVVALSVSQSGKLSKPVSIELEQPAWGTIVARDGRAFLTGNHHLVVVDAQDPEKLSVQTHFMPGWYCASLEVRDDVAYCAMQEYGVKTFPLD